MATINHALSQCLLFFIRVYRLVLSPFFGYDCRFSPSCSAYSLEAIQTYGAGKGFYLALRRVLRCHPWHPGGNDSVPLKK